MVQDILTKTGLMRLLLIFTLSASFSFAQSLGTWNYELSKTCFNSKFDDFGVRKIAGRYFMISASVDSGNVILRDQVSGKPFTDLYEIMGCKRIDATLKFANTGQHLLISSPQNDGNMSGDLFGKVIFFSANHFDSLGDKTGLFYVKRTENGWSEPHIFPLNSKHYNLNHPCYDPYSKKLYFSSTMPGGKGGNDLYVIPFDGISFGKTTALSEINTAYDDVFPALLDGLLYFSSNRPGGQGGLDVYVYNNQNIEALPKTVNSLYDDFDYYPCGEFSGFVASNREGLGKNDEVYFVTRASVPLHVLNVEREKEMHAKLIENIALYSKLNLSSEMKKELNSLKNNSQLLVGHIIQLEDVNSKLNSSIPELLNLLVKENLHTDTKDYDSKERTLSELSLLFEEISTTHDSVRFSQAFNQMLQLVNREFLVNESNYTVSFNETYKEGLFRIRSLSILNERLDQLLGQNEGMYFSVLSEKSTGISQQEWDRLSATQAGLTAKLALLEEQRKADELTRRMQIELNELEFKIKEFLASSTEDKFNSFYALDSLFNEFKANPTAENAAKLAEALNGFNPTLLQEIAKLVEANNANRSQLQAINDNLLVQQVKFDKNFEKEFTAFSNNMLKGETIGLKEELNRIKNEYGVTLSTEAELILSKQIFSEGDVVAKFSSLGNILFAFDSYALTREAKIQLDSAFLFFKEAPNVKLLLSGYTDDSGPDKYNLKLSKNRANSVRTYLIKRGVPRKSLVMYYHGEKFPSVENSTREGRKLNRRVELKLEIPSK